MNDLEAMLLGMGTDEIRENYIKLPFAFPGSKGEQLSNILPHLPYGRGYGEAFGGSGVVLINREPSRLDIFNDRYSGITAFFRVVRDKQLFDSFMARVDATVHSREEFIWCKNTWRDTFLDDVERAARWYYMIRFAVNCKPQSTFGRSCNPIVTFADRLHKSLPLFFPIHRRLQPVTIENLDWRQCLDDFDQTGFVWYLDPTYLDSSPGTYEHELSTRDHIELISRVQHLHGFVAVSSYDTPMTRAIYDISGVWDEVLTWKRTTRANTQTVDERDDRPKVQEMLWIRKNRM